MTIPLVVPVGAVGQEFRTLPSGARAWRADVHVDVRDHGAISYPLSTSYASMTDSAAAINAAAAAALAAGLPLVARGRFRVDSTVTLACDGDLDSAEFVCNSTSIAPVVRIGTITPAVTIERLALRAPKVTNTTLPVAGVWLGTSVGIELANLAASELFIPYIRGFVDGLLMTSYGTAGTVYNTVQLGHLRDNKRQQVFSPTSTTSWVTENTFLGGRFAFGSSQGTEKAGVRQILMTNPIGGYACDDNRWYGTSLEGNCPEYHLEIQKGTYNYWDRCRWETAEPIMPKVLFGEISATEFSTKNHIFGGVYSDNIIVTQSANAKRNRVTGEVSDKWESSNSTSPLLWLLNKSSGDNPIIRLFNAAQSVLTVAATAYEVSIGSRSIRAKQYTDTEDRFTLDCTTGHIVRGPGGAIVPSTGLYHGAGSPEGVQVAGVGSLYQRSGGGAGTCLYVKESGVGNTGWVAK